MKSIKRFVSSFLVAIVALGMLSTGLTSVAQAANIGDYHSAWYSQSDYLTLAPNEAGTISIEFKNTGLATWYNTGNNPVDLGTSEPLDRYSSFYSSSWLAGNRPATLSEASVAPGQVGTFVFEVIAPSSTGVYREYFRPVVENLTWLEDNGVFIEIIVTGSGGGSYISQLVTQSDDLTLEPGEKAEVWVKFRNNGTSAWYSFGEHPIHLATSNYRDRNSVFYNSDWLSSNRPAGMNDSVVWPGDTVTFTFDVRAPYSEGNYTEYFSLVAEGLTWMNDTGLNWQFRVDDNNNNDDDFDLTARNTDDGIKLEWDEWDNNEVDSYRILRSTSDSTPDYPDEYYDYVSRYDNDYIDEDVDDGDDYYYRVAAYDNGDVVAYSETVHITYRDDNNDDYDVESYGDFDLTARSKNDGVELEWDEYDDENFDYYVILRSTSDSTPDYSGDYYDKVDDDEYYYFDDDVDNDRYYYRVAAYDNGDVVAYSDAISIYYDEDNNSGRFDLDGHQTDYEIELEWDEYDDESFDYYVILRSTSDSTPDYPSDYYDYVDDNDTDYNDSDVENGERYYYRIGAYEDGDVLEYSDVLTITFEGEYNDQFDLSLGNTDDGVELDWDEWDDDYFDYYVILRSTSDSTPDYPSDYYDRVDDDEFDYLDEDVTDGKKYYYRVAAYDNGQVLAYSSADSIIYHESDIDEYDLDLDVENGVGEVILTWDVFNDEDIDKYRILRSTSDSSPTDPDYYYDYVNGSNSDSYVDDNVTEDQRYFYRLSLYENGQVIGYSETVSIRYEPNPEDVDLDLDADLDHGYINLTWDEYNDGDFDGYYILRSEIDSTPTYPDNYVGWTDDSKTEYLDDDTNWYDDYYYRLAVYSNSKVVAYSEIIYVDL